MSEITVEVAYAEPANQKIIAMTVPAGITALEAVEQSGIGQYFPDLNIKEAKMGIFGKAIQPQSQVLAQGDRVEIYRPLIADPKASRKARADKAKQARTSNE